MNRIFHAILTVLFISASAYADNIDRTTDHGNHAFGNLEKAPHLGNVVYAAQPDEATTKTFKEHGFDLVINIRGFNEDLGFDEKAAVESQGIEYKQIPYLTAPTFEAGFSHAALSEIKSVIDEASLAGKKILLHCSHGQRAGSTLGAILYRDYGYSKDDALKMSLAAGLSSEWGIERLHKMLDETVRKVEPFGGINNMVKYKNFYIGSQPSAEAIKMMKDRGITTVITNRAEIENDGFPEQQHVEDAGLKFMRARIYNDRYGDINDGKLNVAELEKALGLIANTKDGDVYVHCGSGDRASMILAAHLYNVDKISAREALSKARQAGLKHPGITEQLEIYMGVRE
ncbi:hypothetical protein [Pseudemcibacter aquimaris]|uniref:hypothetical protein n=1 Tax=Pseudemcibacter aquimaris TaxID=2857064 RepID=UPI0020125F75|nr:hypothetical protein [Pseudemcibacter aquimaris]MCC3861114.1 hypothetical protein [Pseudemcibacter aquimaris]WDU59932.1 dual specificity protein phosphatase family protein [Pseudemcibacter aquimaris]